MFELCFSAVDNTIDGQMYGTLHFMFDAGMPFLEVKCSCRQCTLIRKINLQECAVICPTIFHNSNNDNCNICNIVVHPYEIKHEHKVETYYRVIGQLHLTAICCT